MSVRTRVIRKRRKEILRHCTDFKEEALNRDDDGMLFPKKDRGYCVEFKVNGFGCSCPDRNRFEAMYAAVDCARWLAKKDVVKELEEEREAYLREHPEAKPAGFVGMHNG